MEIFEEPNHDIIEYYHCLLEKKKMIINDETLLQQVIILLNINNIFYEIDCLEDNMLIKLIDEETDCIVKKIECIGETEEYVYDLETEVSTFQAGIGNVIVHNTDSIFIIIPSELESNASQKDIIEESMKKGSIIANEITSDIGRKDMVLEYEKTFLPLILFSKKRYVGKKYEENGTDFTRNSMGIVTKRRDNAPIVKDIYNGTLDLILEETNKKILETKVIDYVEQFLNDIVNAKFSLDKFVITKTLRNKYANPDGIAHKVLADRMKYRDPGNSPQVNDRVPFAYIGIDDTKLKETKYKNLIKLVEENLKKMNSSNQKQMILNMFKNINDVTKKDKFKSINTIINTGISGERIKEDLLNSIPLTKELIRKKMYEQLKKKIKITQGDRVEHPDFILENKLRLDYSIYIENQLLVPLCQLTDLVTPEARNIFAKYIRKENNIKKGNLELDKWFL